MRNFRTYHLALNFYHSAKTLKLSGPAKNQFERALLSIPLNLAEGTAKPSNKERRKYFHISLGSLREVQTILALTNNTQLNSQLDTLAARLYKLCKNT